MSYIVVSIIQTISALAPVLIVVCICMALFAGMKYVIDSAISKLVALIMQGDSADVEIGDYVSIDNKNIVFTKDENGNTIVDIMLEEIENMGLSAEAAGLIDDNLMEKILQAEIVTNYPNLGGNGLQGIVNFYRRPYDADENDEGTLMEYVSETDFNNLLESGNWDKIKNVFTIKETEGTSTSNKGGKGTFINYNLTDEELRVIALACEQEQGTPAGAAAEASLVANQVEMNGDTSGSGVALVEHLQGSWFGSATHDAMNSGGNANSEIVEAVRSVLVDGKRTLPGYIDEHDGFGEFVATTNGVDITSDRSQYVQFETHISNDYGSNYTFYCFPDDNSDPFGYTSEEKRAEIGEFHYDFETGQPVGKGDAENTEESGTSTTQVESLDNFLVIGDSISSTLKSNLESQGAIVYNQGGENAAFFLGNSGAAASAGVCQQGEYFDWNSRIANLETPSGIYIILGQNLCGGGESWINSGIEDYKSLIEKLHTQFPDTPIFVNSVLPATENITEYPNYMSDYQTVADKVKGLESEYDYVTYVDILEGYTENGYAKQEYTSDGLHPNEEGANLLAENIKNGVTQNTQNSSSSSSSSSDSILNESLCIVIATYNDVDGEFTIGTQKINYQLETSKYGTPSEFFISHLQVTNDPQYVEAMTDMVINNSKINYVIQDQYKETTVTNYESYKVNKYDVEDSDDGSIQSVTIKDTDEVGPEVVSTKTTKTLSVVSYVRDADTWIVKAQQKFVKKESGPSTSVSNEQNLGDGNYDSSTNEQIVDRRTWTETSTYTVTYVPTSGTVNSNSTTGSSGNSGAVLGNNETANKIMQEAENQLGVPYVWGGTTPSGFDCSGLVQYCCTQAGANIPPRTTGDYPSSASQYEVALEDIQPGDVLWNDSHVGIYIGNDQYIHAPQTGDVVKISSLSSRQSGKYAFTRAYRFW